MKPRPIASECSLKSGRLQIGKIWPAASPHLVLSSRRLQTATLDIIASLSDPEPRPSLILVDFVGEREQISLNLMSLRFSDGLAEVYAKPSLKGRMCRKMYFCTKMI